MDDVCSMNLLLIKTRLNHNFFHPLILLVHKWLIWKLGIFNPEQKNGGCSYVALRLETVQDFLIKLDIKPLMHLLKISIFSLNKDIIRLTKIMNNLVKDCKIRTFKVIFQCLKLVQPFQLLLMKFFENFDF